MTPVYGSKGRPEKIEFKKYECLILKYKQNVSETVVLLNTML